MIIGKITPNIAEICGIHAGDGYLRNDGEHVELDISGHMNEDKSYYDEHVAPLFCNTFRIKLFPKSFLARRTYGFVIGKRKIVRYFHEFLGFPYGTKTYTVRVPQVIIQSRDKTIYARFMRGLFDTDGSLTFRKTYGTYKNITFKRTHHTYPRIILSTVSEGLAFDVKRMLNFLGIQYRVDVRISPKENEADIFRLWICGKSMLKKWMEKIGFKNPVQTTRYEIWKKFGFCPPNTSLDERIQMLKGI